MIVAGTILGGIALIEWLWPMFWTGVAVFIGGGVLGWRTNIMSATSEWSAPQTRTAEERTATRQTAISERRRPEGINGRIL